jgi:adenylate kinase
MNNVIFIAPPAAGKGTQSSNLVNLGYEHISTGDMLREEIAKESEIGLIVKDIISKGMLVSDEIVFDLINKKLSNLEKPFILDGFPRTIKQAELLDDLLNKLKINNYEVIYLDINSEDAMKRALGRLTCNKCGASFNKYYEALRPMQDGICDNCGNKLETRSDDNEESFKVRFNTFIENTKPIKEFYSYKNKLHNVDATMESLDITNKIKDILK